MVEMKKKKKKKKPTRLQVLRLGIREKERQMPRHDEKILFLLPAACTEPHASLRVELKLIKTGFQHRLHSYGLHDKTCR